MNTEPRKLIRKLEAQGAIIISSRGSSHVKIYDRQGKRIVAIISINDSTRRAVLNVRAQLRREGYMVD